MTDGDGSRPLVHFIREGDQLDDAFGAHSRLASAMQDALEADPTLEVIGLFGSWGSGKSRVVGMLESRMANETTHFFTYDAWVHQSDAPRRAFLEALIRFLDKKKLADTKSLEEALGRLLKKTETVEVTSRPEVSIGFGFVLSLLLIAPVSAQFLRADWQKPSANEQVIYAFGMEYSTYFTVAFWISLLPFLILIVITAYRFIQGLRGKHVGGGLTALFASKAQEVRRDLKRTDPEPTALEFQKFFRDLLRLVDQSGGRRLLFVIDNLDRLPDQELMALWSSIRSLFHGEEKGEGERPPTLLLPLDFGAVERVYEKEGVAQGFADKTFDLVFRVPGPINSLWQEYLRTRIAGVFRENAKKDWFEVAARALEDGDIDSRLPRAINIYVNELATLWLQWRKEDVSFAAIAYYAAKRVQIEAQPWRALQQQIPWMAEFDPNWTRGVAALRYGAPPALAAQILIEQPLRDAIESFDRSAFLELSRYEGFGTVLRRTVEPYRTNSTSLPVTRTALLVAELDPSENYNIRLAWSCLADGVRTDSWDPRTVEDADALSLILSHTGAPARARARAGVRDKLQHRSERDIAEICVGAAQAVRVAAQSATEDNAPFAPISIAGGPGLALALAQELGRDAPLVMVQVEHHALAQELINYSVTQEKPLRPVVEAVVAWMPTFPWPVLVDLLVAAVEERNAQASARLCELLGELWRAVPNVRSKLKESLHGGTLLDRLMNLARDRDIERAALVSAVLLLPDDPEAWPMAIWDDIGRDEKFPVRINAQLSDFAPDLTVDHLVSRAAKMPALAPLVQAMVRGRSASSPVAVAPAGVARRLELYLQVLPPATERAFWGRVVETPEFWKALEAKAYGPSDLDNARTLCTLVGDSPSGSKARLFLADRMNAAPASEWQAALEEGGPLYDELVHLEEVESVNGRTLVEGLTRSAANLAKKIDPAFERRWFGVAERLKSTSQKLVYRTLSNRMLEAGARRPVRLLRAGGRPLLKALRSPRRAEHILQRVVLSALGDSPDVQWLAQHSTAIAAAVASAPERSLASAIHEIDRRIGLAAGRPDYVQGLTRLSKALRSLQPVNLGE